MGCNCGKRFSGRTPTVTSGNVARTTASSGDRKIVNSAPQPKVTYTGRPVSRRTV